MAAILMMSTVDSLRRLNPQTLRDIARYALAPVPAWGPDPRPPIYFEEWVYLAGYHADQCMSWRTHEYRAREHYGRQQAVDFDLGGEA